MKRPNSGKPSLAKKQRMECNDQPPVYKKQDGLLFVEPYSYTFKTYAKQRWLGQTLLQVFTKEFHDKPSAYYKHSIETGQLTVNGKAVPTDYIVQNSDLIENTIHRHEPPITNQAIQIVYQDEEILVVNKPGSIPVHPTGRYRHNTLVSLLKYEFGFQELHPVNRLDRLTSGLCIFALNKIKAATLMGAMKAFEIQKVYLARVKGNFPDEPLVCLEPIETVSHKTGINMVSANGKPCETHFKKLHFNGRTSLVECRPKTGRTHQIRVHLQFLGFPIANDPI